jgi:hypothetical protein
MIIIAIVKNGLYYSDIGAYYGFKDYFIANNYLPIGERKTNSGVQIWPKTKENKRKRNHH